MLYMDRRNHNSVLNNKMCVGPRTDGRKRPLAASRDAPWRASLSIRHGTDRPTDRQTDTRLVLYAYCYGQCNNYSDDDDDVNYYDDKQKISKQS